MTSCFLSLTSFSFGTRYHNAAASLSTSQLEKVKRLRGELDKEVNMAASNLVEKVIVHRDHSEGYLEETRGDMPTVVATTSGSDLHLSDVPIARVTSERLGIFEHTTGPLRHANLNPLPDLVTQSGWLSKEIISLFGKSEHERFFTLLNKDRLLYFASDVEARQFYTQWEALSSEQKRREMVARHKKQIDLIPTVAVRDVVGKDGQ